MICPTCREVMIVVEQDKIELDHCPNCAGVWFDGGELEVLSNVLRLAADQSMPSTVASRLFQSLIQRIAE